MNATPPPEIPGWYDWHAWATETIKALPAGAIYVELGCFLGKSTTALAQLIRDSGKKISLYAVDLFELPPTAEAGMLEKVPDGSRHLGKHFEANLKAAGVRKLVKMLKKPSVVAATEFPDAGVDVVFVDADHSYEGVCADIKAWWPKLKPGGLMAGHDIHTYDSVWRAVHDAEDILKLQSPSLKLEIVAPQNIWVIKKPL